MPGIEFENTPPVTEPAPDRPPRESDGVMDGVMDGSSKPPAPITDAQVRMYLELAGSMANAGAGRTDDHWLFTDDELDLIAPGVAAYINRHPRLAAAAARGQGAEVVYGIVSYTMRGVSTELAYREEQKRTADRPAASDQARAEVAERQAALEEVVAGLEDDTDRGTWPPQVAE